MEAFILKTKQLAVAALAAALSMSAFWARNTQAAGGPTVDKTSVVVWMNKQGVYFPKPGAGNYNTWAWLPRVDFRVNGPIEEGTKFVVDYTAGKGPVIRSEVSGETVTENRGYTFEGVGSDVSEEKGSIHTGPVNMQIRVVNPAQKLDQVIYKGTLDVKKYLPYDPKQFPDFKNKYDYYVDQDWRLPIAFLTSRWIGSDGNPETTPPLALKLWFRGDSGEVEGKTEAQLFYQGQPISTCNPGTRSWTTTETSKFTWTEASFTFLGGENNRPVFYSSQDGTDSYPTAHLLDKNPGEYEIKVTHKGKLSRSIKFTIGSDGKPVDQGAAAALNTRGRWPVAVKIVEQTDGKWDANAWKTGMFYGNPIASLIKP